MKGRLIIPIGQSAVPKTFPFIHNFVSSCDSLKDDHISSFVLRFLSGAGNAAHVTKTTQSVTRHNLVHHVSAWSGRSKALSRDRDVEEKGLRRRSGLIRGDKNLTHAVDQRLTRALRGLRRTPPRPPQTRAKMFHDLIDIDFLFIHTYYVKNLVACKVGIRAKVLRDNDFECLSSCNIAMDRFSMCVALRGQTREPVSDRVLDHAHPLRTVVVGGQSRHVPLQTTRRCLRDT
ncbi:hypothetical protein EVAR_18021_1 [Eumeta japonica]|uniref:Uncharacterized protein n=1 Tax=Eumeta variegata TaxID=151549 RepID=A0A4C1ZQI6_EUMVA|nr:hypothetical protein EVAR_18021_1 [Eumeta japonica]